MLQPADPKLHSGGPEDERPIGELVHQLVEDGKAYARAEVGVVKAIAAAKGRVLAMPAAYIGAAFLLAIGAVAALAVGVLLALALAIGPILAALVTFLLFGGIAAGLAWYAVQKVRKDL